MAQRKLFDRNTIIVVVFIVLVATGILVYKLLNRPKCPEFKIIALTEDIRVGVPVIFQCSTQDVKTYDWDFGDGTAHSKDATPAPHIFTKDSDYTVTLIINDKCSASKVVPVKLATIDTLGKDLPVGTIDGPATADVNTIVKFKDASSVATSWAWDFGENGKTDATEKEPSYTFKTPGKHTITLVINSNGKPATFSIYITPVRPPGPRPPVISESDFMDKLDQILSGRAPGVSIFTPYICDFIDMPIKVNGKPWSFSSYCKGLRIDHKEYIKKINAVSLTRNPTNGCIIGISIEQTEEKITD